MPNVSPWFGRAWKITVHTQSGESVVVSNSDFGEEALRVTFQTNITGNQLFSWADVVIYNMNSPTEQYVMKQGDLVTIAAGYQSTFKQGEAAPPFPGSADVLGSLPGAPALPAANELGQWTLFQPLFDRENITDYKVTLHCIIGLLEEAQNMISFTAGPRQSQAQIIRQMAKLAHNPIAIDDIDEDTLSQKTLVRQKSIFGRPGDYFEQIAQDNILSHFISPQGLNIRDLSKNTTSRTPDLVFGPPYPPDITVHPTAPGYTPTLIGTPQQTQDGVTFRVLMDSRIKIGSLVRLDLSVVRQLAQFPSQGTSDSGSLPFLDQDGDYVVYQVSHLGDTRGQEWYTDVLAMTKNFWPTYQLAPQSAS